MRTCDACGFENAEPGKPCALCGSSEIVHAASDVSTMVAPATLTPAGGAGAVRFEAGHVFGERYRVVSLLGSGGMGQVFRVEDATFAEPGRVGVWTKADSVTYFDDLKVGSAK